MECRDDLIDTAVAGDGVFVRQHAAAGDSARVSEAVFLKLVSTASDGAVLSDGSPADHLLLMVQEVAAAGEQAVQALAAANLARERAIASDTASVRIRTVVEDGAIASDSVAAKLLVLVTEAAGLGDGSSSQRRAWTLVRDSARAGDSMRVIWRDLVQDAATASDGGRHVARVKTLAVDAAVAGDDMSAAATDATILLADHARLADEVLVRLLRARTVVVEFATAEDQAIQWGDFGQAWTANADNWAMSRYAPFTFSTLAVVDGVVLGCAADGVYALDGDAEQIAAHVTTGKLDMTGSVLAHPVEAHLEYELRGTASVTVTTTQQGTAKTYTYPLNGRPVADELTNARAPFGRGLRGRHFAYTLRLTGTHAHINDWSVLVAPSKRSI